ncbi:MAG: DpnD/PcfM family protein [Eubacteriales bacterium]|nr:DpnD/PcfM family protein [Eubacteriales bacterium]MDD4422948.1 DpnD/PcfM family protein [Eubacteriales bacterium]
MKKFVIAIEEMIVENFEIEVENSEEAFEIAQRKYKNEEIVLSPGEVQFKQITIIEPDDGDCHWIEF